MNLSEYFKKTKGLGVLSTADGSGHVDTAIYATPHILDDHHVAFIMAERKSHQNLKTNPHAAYLFKENGSGYSGLRLYLRKTEEEKNSERLRSLIRRKSYEHKEGGEDDNLYLVSFRVEKILGLTGSGKCPVATTDEE
jgi:Pyridoxamine 5'-phosphate oxidase